MKEKRLETFHVISNLICFLSLLAIYNFCTTAYALSVDRMCLIYPSSLWKETLLFSALLILASAINDTVWEHIWNGRGNHDKQAEISDAAVCGNTKTQLFTTDEEAPTEAAVSKQKAFRNAMLKCTLFLYPLYVVLAELTIYTVSELSYKTISLEACFFISCATALVLSLYMFIRRRVLYGKFVSLLSTRQKTWLRCIVTAVCLISAILFVPRAAGRIATYNMYWEGSPQTPYSFTYKVNDECNLFVDNINGFGEDFYTSYFDLLPRKVLTKFVEDGWTIRIDSNYLAEYSWQNNGKRYGPLIDAISDFTNKTVIAHAPYFALLEIGRYCYNIIEDKEKIDQLFAAEARKLCTDNAEQEGSKEEPFIDAEHFFAVCFADYAVTQENEAGEERLAQRIPLTYSYLSTEIFNEAT